MGTFVHHPDGSIYINGERFEMDVFLAVEPSYSLPYQAIGRNYEQGKSHWMSDGSNSFPGPYPWLQGDIYISRLNDFILMRLADEIDTTDAKEAANLVRFDELSSAQKRKRKYPPFEEMIEALWRHIIEKEDLNKSGCKSLQVLRDDVRNQYPDA